ncbi:DNA-binding protein [Rhizobium sp. TRM95111]|uniref:DNA-binding protein n=1 Tax=Rhizobium alarense TaxID=2846851 RepID=UPI001F3B7A83|nr:DNA-binding protein [Rhizobium alarense]MCF3638612.1 DNA-binding protein [Rhizobium alarense]
MTERKLQIDKFREAARELEADDDETLFDQRLGKLVKALPPKDQKPNEKKAVE